MVLQKHALLVDSLLGSRNKELFSGNTSKELYSLSKRKHSYPKKRRLNLKFVRLEAEKRLSPSMSSMSRACILPSLLSIAEKTSKNVCLVLYLLLTYLELTPASNAKTVLGCQATLALLRDLHRFNKGWISRDTSRNKSGLPWEPWTWWVRWLIGFTEHCGGSKWAKFGPETFRNMRASSDHMHGRQPTRVLT